MANQNKKILGATTLYYNNIKFRSKLECSCYKKLESSGLNFAYESQKFVLWEGTKPNNITIYAPNKIGVGKYSKLLEQQTRALLNITYTPDFIVLKKDYRIYFDVKGKENDTYPIKKKMFLKYLNNLNDGYKYLFFEPHNIRQMLQAIDIIKSL